MLKWWIKSDKKIQDTEQDKIGEGRLDRIIGFTKPGDEGERHLQFAVTLPTGFQPPLNNKEEQDEKYFFCCFYSWVDIIINTNSLRFIEF